MKATAPSSETLHLQHGHEQHQQLPNISKLYKYSILLLASLTSSFNLFIHNTITVLQPALANSPICLNSSSHLNASAVSDCCSDCWGIGNDNYNIMYSIMYSVSVVATLVAGWSADRFGHKMLIVFCGVSVAAHSIIAAAGAMRNEASVLTLLFLGSFFWGGSMMSVLTIRNKIISFWFQSEGLFIAFGIMSSINRASSIPAFLLVELIRERIGLQLTMLLCPTFAIISTVTAVCTIAIDAAGLKKLGITDQVRQESSAVRISDILHFNKLIWPLLIAVTLLPTSYYTLMENSVQMVHQKFGFTKQSAAMISGVLEYVGIVTFVAVGFVVNQLGRPILFLLFGCSLITAMSLLLALTPVHPIIGLMGFGFEVSFYSSAGMGSLLLMVHRSNTGFVAAMDFSLQCFSINMLHFVTAAILGHETGIASARMQLRWTRVLLMIASLGVVAFVICLAVACVSVVQQNSLVTSRRSRSTNYEQISDSKTGDLSNE